ncbi:hypothetical protein Hdeb2414_s0008g00274601 [Helianthus debilis subsp. tardiflorus]
MFGVDIHYKGFFYALLFPALRNKFIIKDFTYGVMVMDVSFGSVIVSAQLAPPFD